MKVIEIRPDLHTRLKVKSAGLGIPLKDYVSECLLFGMLNKDKKKDGK